MGKLKGELEARSLTDLHVDLTRVEYNELHVVILLHRFFFISGNRHVRRPARRDQERRVRGNAGDIPTALCRGGLAGVLGGFRVLLLRSGEGSCKSCVRTTHVHQVKTLMPYLGDV